MCSLLDAATVPDAGTKMESVVVIAPRVYDDEFRARLASHPSLAPTGEGNVVVLDDGKTRVYVAHNDYAFQEMDPERLQQITASVNEPVFYTVDFSDIKFCKGVLTLLVDDPLLLVDNDHGVLLAGSDFVRLLNERPDWDWRLDLVR
jgi:hypothetical protein